VRRQRLDESPCNHSTFRPSFAVVILVLASWFRDDLRAWLRRQHNNNNGRPRSAPRPAAPTNNAGQARHHKPDPITRISPVKAIRPSTPSNQPGPTSIQDHPRRLLLPKRRLRLRRGRRTRVGNRCVRLIRTMDAIKVVTYLGARGGSPCGASLLWSCSRCGRARLCHRLPNGLLSVGRYLGQPNLQALRVTVLRLPLRVASMIALRVRIRGFDTWGNRVCKSFDMPGQPSRQLYDTSPGCPIRTFPSADMWGNSVCKRF
jgi:hypothetical protein